MLLTAVFAPTAHAQTSTPTPAPADASRALATGAVIAASPTPLAYQDALSSWWSAAGHMWLDESAYRVTDPVAIQDGVCSATLTGGMVIPVWAGKPPLSERIVGFVFVGEGQLSVELPLRADRWRVANHAARYGLLPADQQAAIAHGQAPLTLGIDRGLVLSADPKVREFLAGLEPVGGGVMIRSAEGEGNGVDEAYVITERRGKLRVKSIATNMLPQRRLQLERAGLDPRIWLRQDRLLHDELGMDGTALRMLADWRTDTPLHVAAELGAGVGNNDYDRWLACFRDPMDQEGLGFASQAFAYGTDPEGLRHFERLSGTELAPVDERPGWWFSGEQADITVASRPKGLGNERFVDVDAVLTMRAVGGDAQAVTFSMPVNDVVRGSWSLEDLSLQDGAAIAMVGLNQDLFGRGDLFSTVQSATSGDSASADALAIAGQTGGASVPQVGGLGGGAGGAGSGSNSAGAPFSESTLDSSQDAPQSVVSGIESSAGLGTQIERDLVQDSPIEYLVQVVLPQPVPQGETVRLRVHWKARLRFANWSSYGRPMGTTTGVQPLLPEPVPAPGRPSWTTDIRLGIPSVGLNQVDVAITGATTREWDEDTWTWTEAQGQDVAVPAIAIGRWSTQVDQKGTGMPGVRVHLFAQDTWALPEFPPEIRRVVSFLQRFLPDLPMSEIEVYQGASGYTSTILRGDLPQATHNLVEVDTVKTRDVTEQSQLDDVDPYLTQVMLARQVAAEYWGESISPLSTRDTWLTDGLAEAYAGFYVRAAFGNKAYTDRMEKLRDLVEDPTEYSVTTNAVNRYHRFLSLSGATPASDVSSAMRVRYSAYLLGDIIRLRIGDRAFFAALDQLAQSRMGSSVTTDDLQRALEAESGQDLSNLFDFWINGGFIPKITIEVRQEAQPDGGTTLHGCVTSSIPWGSFDVPVEVIDKDGERSVSALVDVDDGLGPFDLVDRSGKIKVRADPMGMTVAYKRQVKTVARTRCDPPPQ
ncbi:MAG: M1 family metallopeptidase [Oligoflexia bacterium]|nr:M1 family metallopeptidase [Oligoflexia bacterium]